MRKWIPKRKRYHLLVGIAAVIFMVCTLLGYAMAKSEKGSDSYVELTDIELLGKYVFFDKISNPPRMACVTCHDPETGGTGGVSGVNLHQVAITGANPHTVGNLKPPTNAYATFIEPIHTPCTGGFPAPIANFCGGNFWNGRAEGRLDDVANQLFPDGATKHIGAEIFLDTFGSDLPNLPDGTDVQEYDKYFGPVADQALNPMPNIVEQNIQRKGVCEHVKASEYAPLYKKVWGVEIDCSDTIVADQALDLDVDGSGFIEEDEKEKAFDISFKRIMLAVCAWQASEDLNSFSSKRDKALQRELDGIDVDDTPGEFPLVGLTDEENYGHALFYATRFSPLDNGKFANCAFCHSDNPVVPGPGPKDTGAELQQLYSADDYHNIGTPRNPEIPDTGVDPDLGFTGHGGDIFPPGFHKTPSLRNVNKRKGEGFIKAYTHNGWFKSMESIVHFYNTAFTNGGTAALFGVTRCPDSIMTEKDALKNNCWPAPAYGLDDGGPSAIPFLVGDLGLTAEDEAAIVAYLKTLTDEYTAKAPKPYKPASPVKKGKK